MAGSIRLAALGAALVGVLAGTSAQAAHTHKLTLAYFPAAHAMTAGTWSTLVASFQDILQRSDSPADVVCSAVHFKADGTPAAFADPPLPAYVGEGGYEKFRPQAVSVFQVAAINWCGGAPPQGGRILGCAGSGGSVIYVSSGWDTQVVLHELGHAQGLRHVTDKPNNVMYPVVGLHTLDLTQDQCDSYHSGPQFAETELPPSQAETPPSDLQEGSDVPTGGADLSLNDLIQSAWIHGPPNERIQQLSEDDLQTVRAWLAGDDYGYWPNSVTVLGLRGSPADVDLLKNVAETDSPDPFVRDAKLNVPRALGFLAARTQSEAALGYLQEFTAPESASRFLGQADAQLLATEATSGLAVAAVSMPEAAQAFDRQQELVQAGQIDLGVGPDFFASARMEILFLRSPQGILNSLNPISPDELRDLNDQLLLDHLNEIEAPQQ